MSKILLITNKISESPQGGREMLCKLNFNILQKMYNDNCIVMELNKTSIRSFKDIIRAFNGFIDGITKESIKEILKIIEQNNISKIFIDGSNFGNIAKIVKNKYPNVEIITFFHNVESRFFLGALKETKTIRALAVLIVNYLVERKSVNFSDKILCINRRDSDLLEKIYRKGSSHLYPMSLEDKLIVSDIGPTSKPKNEKFALFVGGTFYANKAGIFWFINNIVPHIKINIYIVGRGFEKFKKELEINDQVKVIGAVDSLQEWYINSQFVIAPIFDGSGMKTKVAEALMYGKKILGTPEAFTGYEDVIDKVGYKCETVEEFVNAINLSENNIKDSFDLNLREIYEKKYSHSAAEFRLSNILKDNNED